MSTVKGIAWAIQGGGDERQRLYAVVGTTVFKRRGGGTWYWTTHASSEGVDAVVLATLELQESEGAVLAGGPVEFEAEVQETVELTNEEIGRAVEWVFGLDPVNPPRVTVSAAPPSAPLLGDIWIEANEMFP